jgi:hypothetical protein
VTGVYRVVAGGFPARSILVLRMLRHRFGAEQQTFRPDCTGSARCAVLGVSAMLVMFSSCLAEWGKAIRAQTQVTYVA